MNPFIKHVVTLLIGLTFLATTTIPALAGGLGLKFKIPFGSNSKGYSLSLFAGEKFSKSEKEVINLNYAEIPLINSQKKTGVVDTMYNANLTGTEKTVIITATVVAAVVAVYIATKDDNDHNTTPGGSQAPPPGDD